MTDAANYGKVFRAAANGALKSTQKEGSVTYYVEGHVPAHIQNAFMMSRIFGSIADVFEGMAEAEQLPTNKSGGSE